MGKPKEKAVIVKASTVSHAKRGYYVFIGSYPDMKGKYAKNKKLANKVKERFDAGKPVKGTI